MTRVGTAPFVYNRGVVHQDGTRRLEIYILGEIWNVGIGLAFQNIGIGHHVEEFPMQFETTSVHGRHPRSEEQVGVHEPER